MPIVKVAEYRNMTDRLSRQVRVDKHACKGVQELAVWRNILGATIGEAMYMTCPRASAQDVRAFQAALIGARMAL